jgi:hypothetical protein
MTCPQCHRTKLVRSSRKTLGDYAQAIVGLYPFRCPNCNTRTKVWSIQQAVIASMPVMGFLLFLSLVGLWYRLGRPTPEVSVGDRLPPVTIQLDGFSLEASEAPSPGEHKELLLAMGHPLTNQDIVSLTNAGIGEDVILRLIKERPTQFAVQVSDLVVLRQAGVKDAVLAAVIDTMHPSRVPSSPWEARSASLKSADSTGRVAVIRQ